MWIKRTVSLVVVVCFTVTTCLLTAPPTSYAARQETIDQLDKEAAKEYIETVASEIEKDKDVSAVHLHRKLEKLSRARQATEQAKKVLEITGKLGKPRASRITAASLGEADFVKALTLLNFTGVRNDTRDFNFSHDHKVVFVRYTDKTSKMFDLTTGNDLEPLIGPNISGVVFSPGNKLFFVKYRDKTCKIFDLATKKDLGFLVGSNVSSVSFSPDSKFIFMKYTNGRSGIFDLDTGGALGIPMGSTVSGVHFLPNSELLSVTYANKTKKVFDLATGGDLESLIGSNVSGVNLSPDGKLLSVEYTNNTKKIFDLRIKKDLKPLVGDNVSFVKFSPDSRLLFVGYNDQTRKIFNPITGSDLELGPDVSQVDFSSDSRLLFVRYYDNTSKVFDRVAKKDLGIPIGRDASSIDFSPDSRLVSIRYTDHSLEVFDLATKEDLKIPIGPNVSTARFSPDSKVLFVIYFGGQSKAFNLTAEENRKFLIGSDFEWVDFSPDNKLAAVKYADSTRRIFDLATGNDLKIPTGPKVAEVAFSSDSSLFFVEYFDKTRKIFDIDFFINNPAIKQAIFHLGDKAFDALDILSILFRMNYLKTQGEIEGFLSALPKLKNPQSFKESILNLLSLTSRDQEKIKLLDAVGSEEVLRKVVQDLKEKLSLTDNEELQAEASETAINKFNEYGEYLKGEYARQKGVEPKAEGEEPEDEIFRVEGKSLGKFKNIIDNISKDPSLATDKNFKYVYKKVVSKFNIPKTRFATFLTIAFLPVILWSLGRIGFSVLGLDPETLLLFRNVEILRWASGLIFVGSAVFLFAGEIDWKKRKEAIKKVSDFLKANPKLATGSNLKLILKFSEFEKKEGGGFEESRFHFILAITAFIETNPALGSREILDELIRSLNILLDTSERRIFGKDNNLTKAILLIILQINAIKLDAEQPAFFLDALGELFSAEAGKLLFFDNENNQEGLFGILQNLSEKLKMAANYSDKEKAREIAVKQIEDLTAFVKAQYVREQEGGLRTEEEKPEDEIFRAEGKSLGGIEEEMAENTKQIKFYYKLIYPVLAMVNVALLTTLWFGIGCLIGLAFLRAWLLFKPLAIGMGYISFFTFREFLPRLLDDLEYYYDDSLSKAKNASEEVLAFLFPLAYFKAYHSLLGSRDEGRKPMSFYVFTGKYQRNIGRLNKKELTDSKKFLLRIHQFYKETEEEFKAVNNIIAGTRAEITFKEKGLPLPMDTILDIQDPLMVEMGLEELFKMSVGDEQVENSVEQILSGLVERLGFAEDEKEKEEARQIAINQMKELTAFTLARKAREDVSSPEGREGEERAPPEEIFQVSAASLGEGRAPRLWAKVRVLVIFSMVFLGSLSITRPLKASEFAKRAEEIVRIQDEEIKGLEATLKTKGMDARAYMAAALAIRDIVLNAPNTKQARQALLVLETILKTKGLDSKAYTEVVWEVSMLSKMKPELMRDSTFEALEGVLKTEGLGDSMDYSNAAKALRVMAKRKPELIKPDSISSVLLSFPEHAIHHSLIHYQIYLNQHFKDKTKDMSEEKRFSIGLSVYHGLKRHSLKMDNRNIAKAVDAIILSRERKSADEIFSKKRKVINIAHSEMRIAQEKVKSLEKEAGVENIVSFRGKDDKQKVRDAIKGKSKEDRKKPLTIFFNGHGGKNHLWLQAGAIGKENSNNLEHPLAISWKELGADLIERGNLENAIIIIDSCYSYNFSINLLNYLASQKVAVLPVVVTVSNFDRAALRNVFLRSLKDAYQKHGGPLLMQDVFDAEEQVFRFQDSAIFIPLSEGFREELGLPKGEMEQPPFLEIGKLLPLDFLEEQLAVLPEKDEIRAASLGEEKRYSEMNVLELMNEFEAVKGFDLKDNIKRSDITSALINHVTKEKSYPNKTYVEIANRLLKKFNKIQDGEQEFAEARFHVAAPLIYVVDEISDEKSLYTLAGRILETAEAFTALGYEDATWSLIKNVLSVAVSQVSNEDKAVMLQTLFEKLKLMNGAANGVRNGRAVVAAAAARIMEKPLNQYKTELGFIFEREPTLEKLFSLSSEGIDEDEDVIALFPDYGSLEKVQGILDGAMEKLKLTEDKEEQAKIIQAVINQINEYGELIRAEYAREKGVELRTEGQERAPPEEEIFKVEAKSLGESEYLLKNFFTFEEYVEAALYDPVWGFYGSGKLKLGYDFGTMPIALSPVFGEMIAEQYFKMWQGMLESGSLKPAETFYIIEFGAGTGILAHDTLQYISGRAEEDNEWQRFHKQIKYVIGERSRPLIKRQKETNKDFLENKLTILEADAQRMEKFLASERPIKGVVFSNELLDAFPAHRIVIDEDGKFYAVVSIPALHDVDVGGFNLITGEFTKQNLLDSIKKPLKEAGLDLRKLRKKSRKYANASPVASRITADGGIVLSKKDFAEMQKFFSGSKMRKYRELLPRIMTFSESYVPADMIPALKKYFDENRTEINKALNGEAGVMAVADGWSSYVRNTAHLLDSGYIFTIDDGFTISERLGGDERGYYPTSIFHNQLGQLSNPYLHPGDVDIFSAVDFTSVAREGLKYDFQPAFYGPLKSLQESIPIRIESGESKEKIEDRFAKMAMAMNVEPWSLEEKGLSGKDGALFQKAVLSFVETGSRSAIDSLPSDLKRRFSDMEKWAKGHAEEMYPIWRERFQRAHKILIQQKENTDPDYGFALSTQPLFAIPPPNLKIKGKSLGKEEYRPINLNDLIIGLIRSHEWEDDIQVEIDNNLAVSGNDFNVKTIFYELIKNAIDGSRIYQKLVGEGAIPAVQITAEVMNDGRIGVHIANRGLLPFEGLRDQAKNEGVWGLIADFEVSGWPYQYVVGSRMPMNELMPFAKLSEAQIVEFSNERLLFHIRGLTLKRDRNLSQIGMRRSDLTGGAGLGLKRVWAIVNSDYDADQISYAVDPDNQDPTVTFSVYFPEAKRSEEQVGQSLGKKTKERRAEEKVLADRAALKALLDQEPFTAKELSELTGIPPKTVDNDLYLVPKLKNHRNLVVRPVKKHKRRSQEKITSDRKALKALLDQEPLTAQQLSELTGSPYETVQNDLYLAPNLKGHRNIVKERKRRPQKRKEGDRAALKAFLDREPLTAQELSELTSIPAQMVRDDLNRVPGLKDHPNRVRRIPRNFLLDLGLTAQWIIMAGRSVRVAGRPFKTPKEEAVKREVGLKINEAVNSLPEGQMEIANQLLDILEDNPESIDHESLSLLADLPLPVVEETFDQLRMILQKAFPDLESKAADKSATEKSAGKSLGVKEDYAEKLEKIVGVSWEELPQETQDILTQFGITNDFIDLAGMKGVDARSFFFYSLRDLKKAFTPEELERYWPDMVELAKISGWQASGLFGQSFPKLKEIFTSKELQMLWPGIIEIGKAQSEEGSNIFEIGFLEFRDSFTPKEREIYWNDIVELAKVIDDGMDAYLLFSVGFPGLKEGYSEEELKSYWADFIRIAKANPKEAWELFQFGFPAIKKIIQSGVALNDIGDDFARILRENYDTYPVFNELFPLVEDLISSAEDFRTITNSLITLDNYDAQEYGLLAVHGVLGAENFKKHWPDLVEIAHLNKENTQHLFRYGFSFIRDFYVENYGEDGFQEKIPQILEELKKGGGQRLFGEKYESVKEIYQAVIEGRDRDFEVLDYYDEDDNKIGIVSKKESEKRGLVHRHAFFFIKNGQNQLWIHQRPPPHDKTGKPLMHENAGLWDLAVGGHVKTGHDYDTTAIEMVEEAANRRKGISFKVSPPGQFERDLRTTDLEKTFLAREIDYQKNQTYTGVKNEKPFTETHHYKVFMARFDGVTTPDPREVERGRWVSEEDLEELLGTGEIQLSQGAEEFYKKYKDTIFEIPAEGAPAIEESAGKSLGREDKLVRALKSLNIVGIEKDIEEIIFSPDGKVLFVNFTDNTSKIFDLKTKKDFKSLVGSDVRHVDFSPDGRFLSVMYGDTRKKVFDLKAKKDLGSFAGPDVHEVKRSPDNRVLFVKYIDDTVQILDLATEKDLKIPVGDGIFDVEFSPDGRFLSVDDYRGKKVFDLKTKKDLAYLRPYIGSFADEVKFSPDGKLLYVMYSEETGRVFNLRTKKDLTPLLGLYVSGVSFSPDGRVLFVRFTDDTNKAFDLKTKKDLEIPTGDYISDAHFSPDGRLLFVTYTDTKGKVFDLKTKEDLGSFIGSDINDVKFSHDNKLLFVKYADDTAKIFDLTTKEDLEIPIGADVSAAEFSPDGRFLSVGYDYQSTKVFDLNFFKKNPMSKRAILRFGNDVSYGIDFLSIFSVIGYLKNEKDVKDFLPVLYGIKNPKTFRKKILSLFRLKSKTGNKANLFEQYGSYEQFYSIVRTLQEKFLLARNKAEKQEVIRTALKQIDEYKKFIQAQHERTKSLKRKAKGEKPEDEIFQATAASLGDAGAETTQAKDDGVPVSRPRITIAGQPVNIAGRELTIAESDPESGISIAGRPVSIAGRRLRIGGTDTSARSLGEELKFINAHSEEDRQTHTMRILDDQDRELATIYYEDKQPKRVKVSEALADYPSVTGVSYPDNRTLILMRNFTGSVIVAHLNNLGTPIIEWFDQDGEPYRKEMLDEQWFRDRDSMYAGFQGEKALVPILKSLWQYTNSAVFHESLERSIYMQSVAYISSANNSTRSGRLAYTEPTILALAREAPPEEEFVIGDVGASSSITSKDLAQKLLNTNARVISSDVSNRYSIVRDGYHYALFSDEHGCIGIYEKDEGFTRAGLRKHPMRERFEHLYKSEGGVPFFVTNPQVDVFMREYPGKLIVEQADVFYPLSTEKYNLIRIANLLRWFENSEIDILRAQGITLKEGGHLLLAYDDYEKKAPQHSLWKRIGMELVLADSEGTYLVDKLPHRIPLSGPVQTYGERTLTRQITPEGDLILVEGKSLGREEKYDKIYETLTNLTKPVNVFISYEDYEALSQDQREELFGLAVLNPKELKIVIYGAKSYEKRGENIFITSDDAEASLNLVPKLDNNIQLSKIDEKVMEDLATVKDKTTFFRYQNDSKGLLAVALLLSQAEDKDAFAKRYGLEKKNGFFVAVSEFLNSLIQDFYAQQVVAVAA